MPAFADVQKIKFEGPKSKNLLAFHYYDENEVVEGKTMKDHLRFSVAYWHTFRGTGGDPFGPGTMQRPWESGQDTVENAVNRTAVAFEFMEKLGTPFYCFHDRDVAPEGKTLAESNQQSRRRGQGAQSSNSSAPASGCCGARPTCSATPATCMVPPPAPTPMRSPSRPRR